MNSSAGFSLIETMIFMSLALPVLGVVITASTITTKTVSTTERVSEVSRVLEDTTQRIAQWVRPAVRSTIHTRKSSADMEAGRASSRQLGDWCKVGISKDLEPDQMIARGDVVLLVHADSSTIESQEISYDPEDDRIWSDFPTVQTFRDGRVTSGSSFESDMSFENIRITDPRGGARRVS